MARIRGGGRGGSRVALISRRPMDLVPGTEALQQLGNCPPVGLCERSAIPREVTQDETCDVDTDVPGEDPLTAMLRAVRIGDRIVSQAWLREQSQKLTEKDIQWALADLDGLPIGLQYAVMGQWARLNPLAAMEFIPQYFWAFART